jgi:hypothetical protein
LRKERGRAGENNLERDFVSRVFIPQKFDNRRPILHFLNLIDYKQDFPIPYIGARIEVNAGTNGIIPENGGISKRGRGGAFR